jgi:hypothetical protein
VAPRYSSCTSVGTLMGDATLRSIYSVGDETVEMFEQLHAMTQARSERSLRQLEAVVAGLNGSFDDDEPAIQSRYERQDEDRRRTPPEPLPFVALPKRTTHGGPFGPKVREKLTREALGKRGW